MPTISENLLAIDQIRRDLRESIESHNQPVVAGTSFDKYPSYVRTIGKWSRPPQWPDFWPPPESFDSFTIRCRVSEAGGNFIAFSVVCSGSYSVSWGDGTTNTYTSGTTATKDYSYSAVDLINTQDSLGYKQAIITVTGTNITDCNLGIRHPTYTGTAGIILEIRLNLPNCSSLTARSSSIEQIMCRHVDVQALGPILSCANLFTNFYSLSTVKFAPNTLVSVTTLANMFSFCYELETVEFPSGSLAQVTSLASTFLSCHKLTKVVFPTGSLALVTTILDAFRLCHDIKTVVFPAGSLSQVTTAAGAFRLCYRLESVTFPTNSFINTTDCSNMFTNCYMLNEVIFPSGLSSVTTISSMFALCSTLKSIQLPINAFSAVSVTTNAFQFCISLENITNMRIPVTFSVAGGRLSATALNNLYSALPTVVGRTITVTGNFGTSGHNATIAQSKGWTVAV